MSIQHLYFLRHAEALHNKRLPHGPMAEVPLSEDGFETVTHLPDALRQADFISKPDVIFCSPLLRTIQTAKGVQEVFPDVPFEENADLIEWANFDIPTGHIMTLEEKMPLVKEIWARTDPHYRANDLGETFHDSVLRTQRARMMLLNDPRDHIFCVSHGHFIRTFTMDLRNELHPTGETMLLNKSYQHISNLDIVHITHARDTGDIAITYRRFKEDYAEPRPYPYKKPAHIEDKALF
jgi:broad specificity phosphatase PhoE